MTTDSSSAFPMPPSVPPGYAVGTQPRPAAVRRAGGDRALDATFRHTDSDGTEWIYHLSLYGVDGAGLDLSNPVDREHLAYAKRCKEPGWEELRPVLMLAPRPIRPVLEAWGAHGEIADESGVGS